MPPISINVITKDCPEALEKCLTSVYEAIYEDGDELIVVDTGSSTENLATTRNVVDGFANSTLFSRPDLTVCMDEQAAAWIPQWDHLVPNKIMRSFAAAREIARTASKNPVIFWIDCDDILSDDSSGGLRQIVNDMMNPEDPKINTVFLDYNYAHDADGTCTTILKRERFVFKDFFEWKGRCHETMIPAKDCPALANGYFQNLPARVVHQKPNEDKKDLRRSDVRNYLIMRQEYEEDGGFVDPRTRFYYSNACRGLELFPEALDTYREFVRLSGSQEDRWASWYYMAGIYLLPVMSRPLDALDCYTQCTQINVADPRGYFGIARANADLQRWEESLFWFNTGTQCREPEGLHSYDPTQVHYHPQLLAARACCELKQYEKALEYTQMAIAWKEQSLGRQLEPDDIAVQMLQETQNLIAGGEICRSIGTITHNLQVPGSANTLRVGRNLCEELKAIPADLEDSGIGKIEPPDPRTKMHMVCLNENDPRAPAAPSIMVPSPNLAIWTGHTGEKWGPDSGKTGIGGSEKMVILLANEIQSRGVNVSVYANMTHMGRGVHPDTGVIWRHWAEFDEKRPRDALVIWRAIEALSKVQCPAKVRMLWLHDVQNPSRYTEEILALADIVQFQSDFHVGPVRDVIPEEKRWVARNGIRRPHPYAEALNFSKKDPKLVAYLSSPDRGLMTAAKIVREAQETDPEIRLVCMYGFTPWTRKSQATSRHRSIPDLGRDCSIDLYERELYELLDEIGAIVLGRVGWDRVDQVLLEAGVWLYPTDFDEISCMAAMEAQAHGCVTCSTVHGALIETLKVGGGWETWRPSLLHPKRSEEFILMSSMKLLAATMVSPKDPRRITVARQAQKVFAMAPLADDWISRLGLATAGGDAARASFKETKCQTTVPATP